LRLFLCGNAPRLEQLLQPGELFAVEERTGIGIDPKTLATEEGVIYKTRKLALAGGVSFYAEIHGLPEEQLRHFDREVVSPWGGERHHVVISRREPLRWMEPGNAGSGRTLVYLATPCFDIAEGVPACLPREGIRAAATAGPVSLSGWDLVKGGPKPTRFGIDAGSVFFLENVALPASLSGAADSLAGYGFSLKGTWTYAQ
jgi:CRISPR-associated protein Cmr3